MSQTELRNSRILSHIENRTKMYEERVALGIKGPFGWRELTYQGLGLLSRKIGRYLIEDSPHSLTSSKYLSK